MEIRAQFFRRNPPTPVQIPQTAAISNSPAITHPKTLIRFGGNAPLFLTGAKSDQAAIAAEKSSRAVLPARATTALARIAIHFRMIAAQCSPWRVVAQPFQAIIGIHDSGNPRHRLGCRMALRSAER